LQSAEDEALAQNCETLLNEVRVDTATDVCVSSTQFHGLSPPQFHPSCMQTQPARFIPRAACQRSRSTVRSPLPFVHVSRHRHSDGRRWLSPRSHSRPAQKPPAVGRRLMGRNCIGWVIPHPLSMAEFLGRLFVARALLATPVWGYQSRSGNLWHTIACHADDRQKRWKN
jgi:hypothetical protein